MRQLLIITLLMISTPVVAFGQSQGERRGWGYAVAGVVGTAVSNAGPRFTVGGGGEVLFYRGLGIGGDLSYVTAPDPTGNGIGMGSIDLAYHFNRGGKVAPFVTGGASAAFNGGGSAGGGNFGGGIQYWPKDHVGVRFEVRDHIFSIDSPHFYTIRVGVTFR
jgi:hypothetical protein